jgi:hypothetical protein
MNVKEKLVSKIERLLLNTILEEEYEGIKVGNFRSKNKGFADAMKSSINL